MSQTATVVFDGQVLRPEGTLDLEPNGRYLITIQPAAPPAKPGSAWDVLDKFTGSIEGPGDWSVEHDHYLYGTPKRNAGDTG